MNDSAHNEQQRNIEPWWLMPSVDMILVYAAFGLSYILRYEFRLFRALYDPTRRYCTRGQGHR